MHTVHTLSQKFNQITSYRTHAKDKRVRERENRRKITTSDKTMPLWREKKIITTKLFSLLDFESRTIYRKITITEESRWRVRERERKYSHRPLAWCQLWMTFLFIKKRIVFFFSVYYCFAFSSFRIQLTIVSSRIAIVVVVVGLVFLINWKFYSLEIIASHSYFAWNIL